MITYDAVATYRQCPLLWAFFQRWLHFGRESRIEELWSNIITYSKRNLLGVSECWCMYNKSLTVSFSFSLCPRNSLLQDELGKEGLFLWTMDTRTSFITTMQESQHLSPEKGQGLANGDGEQFDSGELSFALVGFLHGHSLPDDRFREAGSCLLGGIRAAWLDGHFLSLVDWRRVCVPYCGVLRWIHDWWVGEILTFLWSFSKVCSSYLKWKAVENHSQDIILLSSCPPTHSILFYSLLIKERNVQKLQYFSFVLTFIFVPSDYYYYFLLLQMRGHHKCYPSQQRAGCMLSLCTCLWLDVCSALRWALRDKDLLGKIGSVTSPLFHVYTGKLSWGTCEAQSCAPCQLICPKRFVFALW